jgi:hypothetical protein
MSRRLTRPSLQKRDLGQGLRRSSRIAALQEKSGFAQENALATASAPRSGRSKKPAAYRQSRTRQEQKLSSSALRELNRETISEPLPAALRQVQ